MGDISIKGRSPLLKGGRVGLKQGGAFGPLRGTTAGGVAKAFRGRAGFKESQALQSRIVKRTKIRKEYADLKKAHHTKTKILKKQEVRKELAKKEAGAASLEARHPGFKEAAAKTKYAKYIKKHEEKT